MRVLYHVTCHFSVVTNSLHGVILKREVLKTVLFKNKFYIYILLNNQNGKGRVKWHKIQFISNINYMTKIFLSCLSFIQRLLSYQESRKELVLVALINHKLRCTLISERRKYRFGNHFQLRFGATFVELKSQNDMIEQSSRKEMAIHNGCSI